MPYEVEQKFRVENLPLLEQRLVELGAVPEKVLEQVDHYFNHPSRDFAQTDEALRLRRVGEVNFITYKGPKLDATTKTRRELELPLQPGAANLAGFAEILIALGFRSVAEVRKTRRVLHAMWQQHEIEIALDHIAGLGDFIELELTADENSLAAAKSAITSFAAALGLTQNERRSYLEMLLEKTI